MTMSFLQPFSTHLSIDKDSWMFKLFSRWTVFIFLLASAFSFITSYSESAISCKSNQGSDPNYMNAYCWSYATVLDANNPLSPDYGSGNEDGTVKCERNTDKYGRENSPHQLVTLMLLIHAVLFMIPDIIWQGIEGGMLDQFGTDRSSFLSPGDGEIFKGLSKQKTTMYFSTFVLCELLNLVFTIINFVIMNIFLGDFRMITCIDSLFPTTMSCSVTYYDGSGRTMRDENLCFLGQNEINQQMYLVLWAWFIILFCASLCMITIRILSIAVPKLRKFILLSYTKSNGMERLGFIKRLTQDRGSIGHWFILTQIGRNASPYKFKMLLEEINSGKGFNEEPDTIEMQAADETRKLC